MQENLAYQEQGRGVRLTPGRLGVAIKIKVDGCLITGNDQKKCDYLYVHEQSGKCRVVLVELKGNNYREALAQLAATHDNPAYRALLAGLSGYTETAVAIVAAKTVTNRPGKEAWENEHGVRLRVMPLDRDKTFDLAEI